MTAAFQLWPTENAPIPFPLRFQGSVVSQHRLPDGQLWLPDGMPLQWARVYVADVVLQPDGLHLIHWRGEWREWVGPCWRLVDDPEMRRRAYQWLAASLLQKMPKKRGGEVDYEPFPASRRPVDDFLDALRGLVLVEDAVEPFQWRGAAEVPAKFILPCADGLVDLETGDLMGMHHAFMATGVPEWKWDENDPTAWFDFLGSVFGDDPDMADLLQEVMGLLLSGIVDFQKIIALVGPPRSGKGTVIRVLQHILGPDLSTAMTTSAFAASFGLAGIIGRRLAVVPDMRVDPRVDGAALLERLLQISGGDSASIAVKYKSDWQGLPTARLAFAANELPRLRDDSGALARRLVPVVFKRSFEGGEDTRLTARLLKESAGIARWAAAGLERLVHRGRFELPEASRQMVGAAEEETSAVATFVRSSLMLDDDSEIGTERLFELWGEWCVRNGEKPGSARSFGRSLAAALPSVSRVRSKGQRAEIRGYSYRGLRLRPE